MKIAFIGAHKTGKTTLFNSIKEEPEFESFHFTSEIVQDFNFKTESFFEYMRIQEQIIEKQLVIEQLHENIITDRSVIDNFAYMVSRFMYEFPQYDMEKSLNKIRKLSPNVFSLVVNNFSGYDLLFYTPIEFKVGEPTEEEILYQRNIDRIIKFLLRSYEIERIYLSGTLEKRKSILLEIFNQVRDYYEIN